MPELALALLGLFGLTLVVRVAIQRRRTGGTGLIGLERGAGPLGWLSGALFLAGIAVGVEAPLRVLGGHLEMIDRLDGTLGHVAGTALATIGIAGVFAAQMGMGNSWRVGVSHEQDTDLITGGLFALCRNPIYTAMITAWIGFALMVPTALTILAVALTFLALEGTVRAIEEPYMRKAHGDAYRAYARRVGRFLPRVGRYS